MDFSGYDPIEVKSGMEILGIKYVSSEYQFPPEFMDALLAEVQALNGSRFVPAQTQFDILQRLRELPQQPYELRLAGTKYEYQNFFLKYPDALPEVKSLPIKPRPAATVRILVDRLQTVLKSLKRCDSINGALKNRVAVYTKDGQLWLGVSTDSGLDAQPVGPADISFDLTVDHATLKAILDTYPKAETVRLGVNREPLHLVVDGGASFSRLAARDTTEFWAFMPKPKWTPPLYVPEKKVRLFLETGLAKGERPLLQWGSVADVNGPVACTSDGFHMLMVWDSQATVGQWIKFKDSPVGYLTETTRYVTVEAVVPHNFTHEWTVDRAALLAAVKAVDALAKGDNKPVTPVTLTAVGGDPDRWGVVRDWKLNVAAQSVEHGAAAVRVPASVTYGEDLSVRLNRKHLLAALKTWPEPTPRWPAPLLTIRVATSRMVVFGEIGQCAALMMQVKDE